MKTSISLCLVAGFLAAQTPGSATRFEVADVHRTVSAPNPYTWASGNIVRGSRYDFRKATMIDLIRAAYGVSPDMIVGGPNWLEFDRYDVAAKTDPNTPPATVRIMLQNLLAERFKLALHKDTRPMPGYALAAGKGKPRLQPSDSSAEPGCKYQQQPNGSIMTVYSCHNLATAAIATQLRSIAGDYLTSPVADQSGIDVAWDFDLTWHRRSQVVPAGTERITIFDAVEKELGLSLTPTTIPMQVFVIDRVNEDPGPNPPDVSTKLPPRLEQFEVADLKLNKSGSPQHQIMPAPGGGVEGRNAYMKDVLGTGWDMDWDHVDDGFANLPKWVGDTYLDIHTRMPSYTNGPASAGTGYIDDDARLMVKNLLIERFQMKTHIENRPRNAYSLIAVKPKLKKAEPGNRARCADSKSIPNDPRDANPLITRLISCQNVAMKQFASALHGFAADYIFDEVEDATGLTGTYDFTLAFTGAYLLRAPATGQSADPTAVISLPEAISKQLGLKLELRKRPLPVVVIDSMLDKPLEN